MMRSRLRNRYWKAEVKKTENYFTSKDVSVSLLRKSKKDYLAKLNEKKIIDNKCLWKTVKLFL